MRSYETTFILVPTLEADGLTREIDAVKKVIAGQGGEITAEREWGRRRLAYPIRDFSEGVYHVLRFSLEDPRGLDEIHRHFRLNENILRHLVIRDEGTPLDIIGQASESEEPAEARESKPGAGTAPAAAPESPPEKKVEAASAPEAGSAESSPAAAGGEETRE